MYNNETGEHDDDGYCDGGKADWFLVRDWFTGDPSSVYIVPLGEGAGEVEGPDDALCDRLAAWYREHGEAVAGPDVAEALGLEYVWPVLRRFGPADGYYHA